MPSRATLIERARKVLHKKQLDSMPCTMLIVPADHQPPVQLPERVFVVQLSAYNAESERADGTDHVTPVP